MQAHGNADTPHCPMLCSENVPHFHRLGEIREVDNVYLDKTVFNNNLRMHTYTVGVLESRL